MAEAASLGVEVVVFPKAVMVGYPRDAKFGIGSRSAKGREDYRKHHAPAVDEPGQCDFAMFSFRMIVLSTIEIQE